MNSKDLFGFKWTNFSSIEKSKEINAPAVYIFRFERKIETISGKLTDIVYIGSTKHLSHRIFKNYLRGIGGRTTQRIHKYLFDKKYLKKIEVGWKEMRNQNKAKKKEKNLLENFEKEHDQLPCWNRRG